MKKIILLSLFFLFFLNSVFATIYGNSQFRGDFNITSSVALGQKFYFWVYPLDGNIAIGGNFVPQHTLDVNGDVNASQFCIAGLCWSAWPYIPTEADIDNNALAVVNSLDLNNSLDYLPSSTFIPTEADIDNNALEVVNGLDLNNSLDYLPSSTYIPTESDIDNNALAVVNGLDLNNSLTYIPLSSFALFVLNSAFPISWDFNITDKPYIPTEADIDNNALEAVNTLDLNNSLQYIPLSSFSLFVLNTAFPISWDTNITDKPYIPTEADIDNNSMEVINSLDLNVSLDYLPSGTFIPTETDIDNNALAVVNGLDLNNSLTYIPLSYIGIDKNIHLTTEDCDLNFLNGLLTASNCP